MMQQVDDPIMAIHSFGTICFIACQWPLIHIPLEGERKEVLVETATTQNSGHLSRNQLRKRITIRQEDAKIHNSEWNENF